MRTALLAALLALAPGADAAIITGGDWGGQPLTPANGDSLKGVFTNVSSFTVGVGTTVFVDANERLVIYASTIAIYGSLNGVGLGKPGGNGGGEGSAGFSGAGGGPSSQGGGGAGASTDGGGGGGHGAAGGGGSGTSGGSAGAVYGSTGVAVSAPLSSDDVFMGSGGGGGGGGSAGNGSGGGGGTGGAAVYLESSSFTVTGSILVMGSTAPAVASAGGFGSLPGGGGGGAGGGILVRVTGSIALSNAVLNASGGNGADIVDTSSCRTAPAGGGGAGGRVNIFYRASSAFTASISTAAGSSGSPFCSALDSPNPTAGTAGRVAFGRVAAAPSGFAASSVYVSSVAWTWSASPDTGDGAGALYRVFPATAVAPLTSPEAATAGLQLSATVQSLTPNTTYYRAATAYTDWGDSALSNGATAFTLASEPAASGFSSVGTAGLTVSWTAGSPSNPSYTLYTVQGSTDPAFGGAGSTDLVALSSSPSGLPANTTHYYRARAVNVQAIPTAWSASFATATLAATPASPSFAGVHISSVVFAWSAAGNPAGTQYQAEASSDAFASIAGSSATLNTSCTFFALNTGTVFAFRVRAVNHNAVPTAYTTAISTAAGLLGDTSPPGAPGRPTADRLFSYDGTVTWSWTPASSGVGILKYKFFLGTTPSGDDIISNLDVFVTSHSVAGLATGRTYYALVLPVSNAGVNGFASDPSQGTPVFLPAQEKAIAKPYSWPNPFDPATGPAQIGVFFDEPADVTLKFFDLQGRLVHESSTRVGSAGNQILSWDGTRSGGGRVAPGGYIGVVQKRYGSRTDTQKFKLAVLY